VCQQRPDQIIGSAADEKKIFQPAGNEDSDALEGAAHGSRWTIVSVSQL
jgi:hypothetical protein